MATINGQVQANERAPDGFAGKIKVLEDRVLIKVAAESATGTTGNLPPSEWGGEDVQLSNADLASHSSTTVRQPRFVCIQIVLFYIN